MSGAFPDRIFKRAVRYHREGRIAEANQGYQEVLRQVPGHPPALHLLGVLAMQIGQPAAGADLISAAIAAEPGASAYRNDLGEALRMLGRVDEAAAEFQNAITLDPEAAAAHANLGMVRHAQGQLSSATALYQRAVLLSPNLAAAHMNLGVALLEQDEAAAARTALERANELAPNDPAILLNLGNTLLALSEDREAETMYRRGLGIQPDSAPLMTNLARALRGQNRVAEALEHDRKAVDLAPDLPQARWNLALDYLLLGDLTPGWEGFAWRWRAQAVPPHGLTSPEWIGGSLENFRLLVHAEQGLGDTLQFVRFVSELRRLKPAAIMLLCQPAMLPLFQAGCCEGLLQTVDVFGPGCPIPEHDLRVPLLDLPLRLGITGRDLPFKTSYIKAPEQSAAFWRSRLGDARIGLVWKGRSNHANDRNRSLALPMLERLLNNKACRFVSLQKEITPGERDCLARFQIAEIGTSLSDLADAAAAIAALDLVITVDTALAHLAGSMGKPVWILLPFAPDWRWMLDRSDSPWYPSARLFRQTAPANWTGVLEAANKALADWAIG